MLEPEGEARRGKFSFAQITQGAAKRTLVVKRGSNWEHEDSQALHGEWAESAVSMMEAGEGFPQVEKWSYHPSGDRIILADAQSLETAKVIFKGRGCEVATMGGIITNGKRYTGFARGGEAARKVKDSVYETMVKSQLKGKVLVHSVVGTPNGAIVTVFVDKEAEENLAERNFELYFLYGKAKFEPAGGPVVTPEEDEDKRLAEQESKIRRQLDEVVRKRVDLSKVTQSKGDTIANFLSSVTVGGKSAENQVTERDVSDRAGGNQHPPGDAAEKPREEDQEMAPPEAAAGAEKEGEK